MEIRIRTVSPPRLIRGVTRIVSLRSRLEERLVTGQDGVLLQLTQQVRTAWPLAAGTGLQGVVSDELFVRVNSTARVSRGLDSNWLFVGIRQALTEASAVEIGYVNVSTRGGSSRRRQSHVMSVRLAVSL